MQSQPFEPSISTVAAAGLALGVVLIVGRAASMRANGGPDGGPDGAGRPRATAWSLTSGVGGVVAAIVFGLILAFGTAKLFSSTGVTSLGRALAFTTAPFAVPAAMVLFEARETGMYARATIRAASLVLGGALLGYILFSFPA